MVIFSIFGAEIYYYAAFLQLRLSELNGNLTPLEGVFESFNHILQAARMMTHLQEGAASMYGCYSVLGFVLYLLYLRIFSFGIWAL